MRTFDKFWTWNSKFAWQNDKQYLWAVGYYYWTKLYFKCNKYSEFQEADHNSPEMSKDLSIEKQILHEKIMNSFSQPLGIILEQNSVRTEVSTSNSALQEDYNDCLEEGENPLSTFATQSLETTSTTDTHTVVLI